MSFYSAANRHDGDGYTARKNSTEESSGLLDSPHSNSDEADRNRRQWPLLLIVIVVVETLILAILGSGIVYFLSKSSFQFPPNTVHCIQPMSPSVFVLSIDSPSTGATCNSFQECRLLIQFQTVLDQVPRPPFTRNRRRMA